MREQLIKAITAHANGEIAKHRANVELYMTNPAGIGVHSEITEAIGVEFYKISRYHYQIELINTYL